MGRRLGLLVVAASLLTLFSPVTPPVLAQAAPSPEGAPDVSPAFVGAPEVGEAIPGEWIVALVDGTDVRREAPELAAANGGRAALLYEAALEGFFFEGSEEQARALARHPRVRKVSPNQPVRASAQTLPTGVVRIDADHAAASGGGGAGVKVAILDTGIDLDHPDLVANLDTSRSKNCIGSGQPEDKHGHGTHVAGTVAAVDNGIGVVGVAPEAQVVAVKVLDNSGSGSFAELICGVDHVTADGSIRVANMSLTGTGSLGSCTDGGLREAICNSVEAGVTYAVAAGNDAENANSQVPARYPEVMTVSALDDRDGIPNNDEFASFSNFGSVVDLIAPGVNILSTTRGGGTGVKSGTSMASPHVAGAAALVLAEQPGSAPAEVFDVLARSGECPDGSEAGGDAACTGKGSWPGDGDAIAEPLVDALRAIGGGGGDPVPGDNTAPTVEINRPKNAKTVAGTVSVLATADDAQDPSGTLTVEWRVDGATWEPMEYRSGQDDYRDRWDTSTVADGTYTLTARATDSAGNQTESAPITVTVNNG